MLYFLSGLAAGILIGALGALGVIGLLIASIFAADRGERNG